MPMRTAVYVDGFNLYYGALQGSRYKWLDLHALAARVLRSYNSISAVKYFTARIDARPSDPDQRTRQATYIRALESSGVEVIYGHFLTNPRPMRLATPLPDGTTTVRVIKTEEKGSDVNLGAHLLLDAMRNRFDCALVITGDSDLTTPVAMVIQEFGKPVGVLNPQRHVCQTLLQTASFYKRLRAGALAASQFPTTLTDAGGSFSKPATW